MSVHEAFCRRCDVPLECLPPETEYKCFVCEVVVTKEEVIWFRSKQIAYERFERFRESLGRGFGKSGSITHVPGKPDKPVHSLIRLKPVVTSDPAEHDGD